MNKHRTFHTAASILTLVVCLLLLVYTVTTTNELTASRAANVLKADAANRDLLRGIGDLLDTMRETQLAQRAAFQSLARRNEKLHGRDGGDAPDFITPRSSDTPPGDRSGSPDPLADGDQRERDQEQSPPRVPAPDPPRREPRPSPRPSPDPPPSPLVCVPTLGICVDEP